MVGKEYVRETERGEERSNPSQHVVGLNTAMDMLWAVYTIPRFPSITVSVW